MGDGDGKGYPTTVRNGQGVGEPSQRMYEAVHAHPDGDSTVARLAATAAEYGYDGVVVRNHSGARTEFDRDRIVDAYGIDVAEGVEIRADDARRASGAIGNYRSKSPVVLLHGGTPDLNRFAVENAMVDVLAHPMAGRGDVNHVIAKAAAENGVRLEFDFGTVLRSTGGKRVRAIQGLRKLGELVDEYEVPYVVSADPTVHLELRTPRELTALGGELGFTPEWIERGLAEWAHLVERNRHVQSESFVEPGVERGRYEGNG